MPKTEDNFLGNIKKQTFLHAALILMVANLIVRGIGAVFKFPIYKILGSVGFANYQDAYTLYVIFFAISTAGLPVAISRMISIASSNENHGEEKKIFRLALISFILVGAVGSIAMMIGAKAFSSFVANEDAYYSIIVLAPTLFFVCITSAYRGYFQGHQNMFPTAVSEIIEALCKLFIGLAAAVYAINTFKNLDGTPRLDIATAFAISGLTIGGAGGAFYLFIKKSLLKRKEEKVNPDIAVRNNKDILSEIIKISIPIMFTSSIANLAGLIDSFMMKRRLIAIGWESITAIEKYGEYAGMAVPFFNLPNTLVVAFAVSIIPVIAEAFSAKNTQYVKSTVESTFRVVSIIAMPCAFGLACMSKPILALIYSERMDEVTATAPLLSILGVGVIFVSMMTITNSMLQAQRQEKKTIISMACGMIVKAVSSYILIGIPAINRYGTPISTCLCYLTIMCMNFHFLAKYTKVVPPIRKTFLKPFMAGAVMSIGTILIYRLASYLLNGSVIALIPALVFAVGIYGVLVILFKTLTKDDVLMLPKGAKLYDAMKKKKLID